MGFRRATAVEVIDGASFRLRTDAIIVLKGVDAPSKNTDTGMKAKTKLEELVLKKKVEYETTQFDAIGRTLATVTLEGVDINQAMKDFVDGL